MLYRWTTHQCIYNAVGVHGNSDARRSKSEARKAQRGKVLGFPSPPARGSGERCKLPQWGSGKPWRPGDLERFIGLQSCSHGVDFNLFQ